MNGAEIIDGRDGPFGANLKATVGVGLAESEEADPIPLGVSTLWPGFSHRRCP
ncbi:MAG TPA: hypothetical protein VLK56_07845 [Solirubrobacterales bacterium]|nr:hypothetical protein [Solirubrobacterales bacterium]